jgi:outer membrane usher protein
MAKTGDKAHKMLVELCVNGSCYGTAFIVENDKDHILVDDDALERANLPLDRMTKTKIGVREFIDVSQLGKGSKVELDEKRCRLTLVLPGDLFEGNSIDVRESQHRVVPTAVPSAFMNYAVNLGTVRNSLSLYLDAGLAYGQALLRDNPSWNPVQGFSRGMTHLEYDDTDHDRRWTLGDQYAYSNDGLGGTALIGGFGISRAYDLDPYLITFPQPTISGVLQAPGTVDIYENGVLISQRFVPAGPFSLASLGLGAGSNNVRVVVQDPFGGTSVLQQNFYASNQMLRQGFSDYAYQIGIERVSPLTEGYVLGQPVLLARENYGITEFLTAGARVEANSGLVNGGPNVNLRLPIGIITGGASGSDTRHGRGFATSLEYQFSSRSFSFGAGIQGFSGKYQRIGDDLLPASFRPHRIAYANASWAPTQRLNLSFSAGDTEYADGTKQGNISLTGQYNITGGITANVSFSRMFNSPGKPSNQIMLNLVIPFGRNSLGVSTTRESGEGTDYGFSAQRSVPSDSGFGYSVNGQYGPGGVQGASQLQYQSQYGLVQVSADRFAGQSSGNVLVSGSVVAMDGHVFAARALHDGYALVETTDAPNVVVTHENQPIGRTDGNGNLLVTELLPYQANKVGIDQNSVPLQDEIDATDQVVSVPRMGGTVVRFGVHKLHAARGILMLGEKPVQFGTGKLSTKTGLIKTLIGMDGSFYFSNLPTGKYMLKATTANGDITCPFSMPANAKALTNLGRLACTASGATLQ